MKLLIGYPTRIGPVFIGLSAAGRYVVVAESTALDSYATLQHAVDDAAGGHCCSAPSGADLGSLGLPDEAGDWMPATDLL